ncbi:MAG: flagellar hook-length control protein FliK [Burkholderiales bacterium]
MSTSPANLVLSKASAEPPPGAARVGPVGAPSGFDDALRSAQGAAGRDAADGGHDGEKLADTPPTTDAARTVTDASDSASVPAPPATDAPIVVDAGLFAKMATVALKSDGRAEPAGAGVTRGLPAVQAGGGATPVDAELSLAATANLPAVPPLAQPSAAVAGSPQSIKSATREAPGEAALALREFSRMQFRAHEPVPAGIAERADAALLHMAESADNGAPEALEASTAPARPMAGDTSVTAPLASRQDTTASPARLAIEAPVGTARFIDQAAQRVTWMARNGVEHAEIRVRPADLGPITVRIELTNNEVLVNFAVTQPDTRVAVEDALHRLEEMLAENGLAMSGANVGAQGFGDDESAKSEQSSAGGRPASVRESGASEGVATARRLPSARGLVDTFA